MLKTLVRHGNSKAIVIEKPVLDMLKIDDDSQLEIITNGSALIIMPVNENIGAKRKMEFSDALAWVNENYKEALTELAK
ncbi:MAG: AbrB/MazE/SpoVT family DNA-binding domain-containing protein [Synergistaceae bacterium]|jgi:antitoxin component of MazEF toxin-antitoxin module|nr:AbrB/MazE/SpoVT family DNA-binding domain-containing protein [Synergistaceae bacterium]